MISGDAAGDYNVGRVVPLLCKKGGKVMPFYEFRCENCGDQREYLVKMMQKTTKCQVCNGPAVYQMSFMTVSTGLPNGHIGIKNNARRK